MLIAHRFGAAVAHARAAWETLLWVRAAAPLELPLRTLEVHLSRSDPSGSIACVTSVGVCQSLILLCLSTTQAPAGATARPVSSAAAMATGLPAGESRLVPRSSHLGFRGHVGTGREDRGWRTHAGLTTQRQRLWVGSTLWPLSWSRPT